MIVSKDDIISDVMENIPESIEVFMEYGLGCVGCSISSFESIDEGAKAHGFSDEDVENLVNDINEINEVEEKKGEKEGKKK